MVIQFKRKEEELRRRQEFDNEVDKTLFDFDDEIDNLSEVEERYKCNAFPNNEEIMKALEEEQSGRMREKEKEKVE